MLPAPVAGEPALQAERGFRAIQAKQAPVDTPTKPAILDTVFDSQEGKASVVLARESAMIAVHLIVIHFLALNVAIVWNWAKCFSFSRRESQLAEEMEDESSSAKSNERSHDGERKKTRRAAR